MSQRSALLALVIPSVVLIAGACSPTAATPPSPTVQAVASQAAPTVQAVASQVVPTAQALASQVAPAVSPAASAIASAVAAAPVRITNASLIPGDATITLQNTGTTAVDLSGWSVRVGTATATLPANTNVPSSGQITLHTAAGTSSGTDVYLGAQGQALLAALTPGAQVQLMNPQNVVANSFTLPG